MENPQFPPLNLPPYQPSIQEEKDSLRILDPARRRYVALTPEEWVRQHVLNALRVCGYPLELMQVEAQITVGQLKKRCDIVVYSNQEGTLVPRMIVECKKPSVVLSQKVCDQICRYNLSLEVPYLFLTNGLQHIILKVDPVQRRLQQLDKLPQWTDLQK